VLVAPSLNAPLQRHPRYTASVTMLREWGVHVIDPVESRLAPLPTILAEVRRALAD